MDNPICSAYEDEQTAQQQTLFAYHQQRAAAASAAATPDVLRFLDVDAGIAGTEYVELTVRGAWSSVCKIETDVFFLDLKEP